MVWHQQDYKRATARTVAERAGVSTSTVSRVLNGKLEAISEKTATRVREAAATLGYRPNSLALSLRHGITRTIGLIIPDISDAYFHQLARGVEDSARAEGYVVIFCNTDRDPAEELRSLDILRDKEVDGIIFAGGGVDDDRHLDNREWAGAKVVLLRPHVQRFPSVGVDNRAASIAAVEHLAAQGCRRIACIGGQPNWLIHQVRFEGFRRGLLDVGLELHNELVWASDFRFESGYDAAQLALADGLEFDGLVSFNDYAALGAMQVLRSRGRAIPDDVAVVGFDDVHAARWVDPKLSSIAFPVREIGEAAAQLVLRMARGESVTDPELFPFELKVRASSLKYATAERPRDLSTVT